jgi:RNA polymerase sporulation-specific sigma factor
MANKEYYSFKSEYEDVPDEELIKLVHSGDKNALDFLIGKYNDIVSMKANKFFIIGAEKEDMVQEGMIGLYKAIKSFDVEKQNSFKTFANLCIERQLITAIKTSNRQKHIPLNSSFSLNTSAYDENDETSIMEILDTKLVEDPLETITKKEYFEAVESRIDKNLSTFEKKVLDFYVQGESYVNIAIKLDAQVKAVDNAIQRIRKKAIKCISDDDE